MGHHGDSYKCSIETLNFMKWVTLPPYFVAVYSENSPMDHHHRYLAHPGHNGGHHMSPYTLQPGRLQAVPWWEREDTGQFLHWQLTSSSIPPSIRTFCHSKKKIWLQQSTILPIKLIQPNHLFYGQRMWSNNFCSCHQRVKVIGAVTEGEEMATGPWTTRTWTPGLMWCELAALTCPANAHPHPVMWVGKGMGWVLIE